MVNLTSPEKGTIQRIFDSVAPRYDFLNTFLSLGIDEHWRRRAAKLTLTPALSPEGERGRVGGEKILDLGVGTGKFLAKFLKARPWELAVGVDFASEMLKRAPPHLSEAVSLLAADIHDLPFKDQSFDLVISSFTLRSVKDRKHFFEGIHRVLAPEGKAAFLCLTRPASFLGRALYAPYLRCYLPWTGKLFSHDPIAYRFLSDSIQAFPNPKVIVNELRSSGFASDLIFPFTFGIATLIVALK